MDLQEDVLSDIPTVDADLSLQLAQATNGDGVVSEDELEEALDGGELRRAMEVSDLLGAMHEEMERVSPSLYRGDPDFEEEEPQLLNGSFDGLYPEDTIRGMHIIDERHPLVTPPRGIQPRDVRRMTGKIETRRFAQTQTAAQIPEAGEGNQ